MALILTAAMSGILTMESAAAAAIGTNIGTTSTALFSVLGATHNAVKVAAAHIIFNLITGLVALITIPLLLAFVNAIAEFFSSSDLATSLALFHTIFNILGVALFLPFTKRLVDFLNKRIGREVSKLGKPRYLDDNTLKTPSLAMDALFMELGRVGELARTMSQKTLTSDFGHKEFIRDKTAIDSLILAVRQYCVKIQRLDLPDPVAIKLPAALRVIQYFRRTVDIVSELSRKHGSQEVNLPEATYEAAQTFKLEVRDIINVAHTPCSPEFVNIHKQMNHLDDSYHRLKDELLKIGASGELELGDMVNKLEYYSQMRVMCEQAIKGTTYWSLLRDIDLTCATADEGNEYSWKRDT